MDSKHILKTLVRNNINYSVHVLRNDNQAFFTGTAIISLILTLNSAVVSMHWYFNEK